ncbi:MAG: hypothetical protein AAF591_23455 [Verrucomicrobiota bacterium]
MRLLTLTLALLFFPLLILAEARSSGGSSGRQGGRSAIHKQQLDNRYRPRVFFAAPKTGSSTVTKNPVVPLVVEFSVQVGYVGEVHLFLDNKRIATYPIKNKQRKGRFEIKLDLAPYGPGTHALRLGGNQGLPGKQSLSKQQLQSTKITYQP